MLKTNIKISQDDVHLKCKNMLPASNGGNIIIGRLPGETQEAQQHFQLY